MKLKYLWIIILLVIIILFGISYFTKKILYKKEYSEYVEKYSETYSVDPDLVYAVIKAESNFNPNVKSSKGAIGLMQLIGSTALDICKKINMQVSNADIENKLLEPDSNINIGTKYLSDLMSKYGNVEVAVAAYNAGIGTVDTWIEKGVIRADGSNIEKIPYKETNNYVRKILRDYKIYKNL